MIYSTLIKCLCFDFPLVFFCASLLGFQVSKRTKIYDRLGNGRWTRKHDSSHWKLTKMNLRQHVKKNLRLERLISIIMLWSAWPSQLLTSYLTLRHLILFSVHASNAIFWLYQSLSLFQSDKYIICRAFYLLSLYILLFWSVM